MAFPSGLIDQPLDGWYSAGAMSGGRFNGLLAEPPVAVVDKVVNKRGACARVGCRAADVVAR
jgi:hypothetical protein